MTRKPPIRHDVKYHTREGKRIGSFERGSGSTPQRKSRVVRRTGLKLKQYAFDMGGGYVVARNWEEAKWIIEHGGGWEGVILHNVEEVGDMDVQTAIETGATGIRFYVNEDGSIKRTPDIPEGVGKDES